MQTIFDSRTLPAAKRYKAWQDAICEIYFQVDCTPEERDDYDGLVREARFGPLILTDTLSAPQVVLRQNRHISRLDKDCYIFGLMQTGRGGLCQRDASFTMHTGAAGLFYASEPYDLRGKAPVRAFWMEIPQHLLASRFSSGRAPVNTLLNVERGLGRIAAEFCTTLAAESALLNDDARAKLGDEFLDILAAAVDAGFDREPAGEKTVRKARLRSVKAYIDAHLREPDLTLESIARNNGISLRYLHELFTAMDSSVSDWIWLRRLQQCHALLSHPAHAARSITEIAFSMGFNSSSHFSNRFREEFGLRPSDVRLGGSASRARPEAAPGRAEH
ncbi:MAG: helix-turn-helix domain-containing protein [Methanomicrobiales archaeon]|nr:helix-turn-helix domain-containing protein [Methanomicrobiales archaeon]